MKKYKVEFIETEIYIVDVYADDEQEASDKATQLFGDGNYQETGDINVDINCVYDVTNTDDPFFPEI